MSTLSVSSRSITWYIDSGASTHLFHERSWFTDYEKTSLVKINMGDNSVQEAVGKGNIQVSMSVRGNERVKAILTNVLHVPGIAKNNNSVTKATSLDHFC